MHDAHTPAHDADQKEAVELVKDALEDFGDGTVSLYFPKPHVQVGGEKWRILQKNLADDLSDHAPKAKKAKVFIEELELEDFRGEGVAVFEDPESGAFRTSHMTSGPVAMMSTSGKPLALPLLRDVSERETAWVLALDREEPKLYLYSGGDLIDHSARLVTEDGQADEPVTYETVAERREVQDDIFFHSGSRGRAPAAMARSNFGALGTSAEEEREKTDDAYYELVIKALQFGLPYQVEELYVFGADKTVGRFAQMIEQDLGKAFRVHQIGGTGGEGMDEERIIDTLKTKLPEAPTMPDLETESDADTILQACREGRVGTLYVSDDLSGLDPVSGEDSEHVRTKIVGERFGEALEGLVPSNEIVMAALMQGAKVEFVDSAFVSADSGLMALMRWDKPEG